MRWTIRLVAGAAVWRFYLRAPDFGNRIYRIGWFVSPPFSVRGTDGKPPIRSIHLRVRNSQG